jgi:hypothetical protein
VGASKSLDCSIVHRAGFKQDYWGDLSQREAIANARLIASAPELLELLEDVISIGGGMSEKIYGYRFVERVRAAIAKATGGEI